MGRLAPERLRVMLAWACEDAELARAAGDATREAMKRARAERLERVVARLDAGEGSNQI